MEATGHSADVRLLSSQKDLEMLLQSQEYDHVIALQDSTGTIWAPDQQIT